MYYLCERGQAEYLPNIIFGCVWDLRLQTTQQEYLGTEVTDWSKSMNKRTNIEIGLTSMSGESRALKRSTKRIEPGFPVSWGADPDSATVAGPAGWL